MQFKISLCALLLFLGSLNSIHAQEKYDYAIISYSPDQGNIAISFSDQKFIKIDVKGNNKIKERNFTSVLGEVDKLQELGWELFSTNATGHGVDGLIAINVPNYLFYLRKKRE